MKKVICLLMAVLLLVGAAACRRVQPTESSSVNADQSVPAETQDTENASVPQTANTMTVYRADGSAVILEDCGDGSWKDAEGTLYYPGEDGVLRARDAEDLYTDIPAGPGKRQDGERFEAVIVLEGMEETVRYEHVINEVLGFGMDYEYESFTRHTEAVCDRFTSIYDDPDDPENYLEISYSAQDAEIIAASVRASLSDDYEVVQEPYTLERAGSCIRIDASEVRGGGWMADQLQAVYIIPAADGCRIATVHCAIEDAEGLGRRFSYMLNTLEIIDRNAELAESEYNSEPAGDDRQWTGRDFGELPPEDFDSGVGYGELPPEDFEGWGGDEQDPADNREWTGRDFGELPPEDFYTGVDYGELPPEDFYTGVDYGELPPEDFYTGVDYGEMPPEEVASTP